MTKAVPFVWHRSCQWCPVDYKRRRVFFVVLFVSFQGIIVMEVSALAAALLSSAQTRIVDIWL